MSSDSLSCAPQSIAGDPASRSAVSDAHVARMTDLFNRYHSKLVKSLVARTHSWDDAREIAAQAFAELLSLERPGAVSFFGAYLYRTARNLAEDRIRHRAMCERKAPLAAYEPETASPSPEPLLARDERLRILQHAITELRPRRRMALTLRMWDELSYEEIVAAFAAQGVKLNERTIRRYVAEALEECRRAILKAEAPPAEGQSR